MNDDLDMLAADLARAGVFAGTRAVTVLEESAARIEAHARDQAPRTRLPHLAATITHDVTVGASIVAEIGADKDVNGQAKLAHIFEYGTSALPPRPFLGPALDLEEPRFASGIEDITGRIL